MTGGLKVVMFVPLTCVFVKLDTGIQFCGVPSRLVVYSAVTDQEFVPSDRTVRSAPLKLTPTTTTFVGAGGMAAGMSSLITTTLTEHVRLTPH